MRWREDEALPLGPEAIARLIPHRRPLLLVDGVVAFRREGPPTLWAHRHIAEDEEVFAGHFPGLPIWPGVYTIEGLGQTTLLLSMILHFARTGRGLEGELPPPDPRSGIAGEIAIKLLTPVVAGARLDYCVSLTHTLGDLARFDVEAVVANRPVARGSLTGKIGILPP